MFGVPINGSAKTYCDNQGVVKNVSIPESVLSKKHNSVNYHAVREVVATHIMQVAKEDGDTNVADLLTKPLTEQCCITLLRSISQVSLGLVAPKYVRALFHCLIDC
jgi:hypothetical protein